MKTSELLRISKRVVRKVIEKVKARLRRKPVSIHMLDPREFEVVEERVEQEGLEAL